MDYKETLEYLFRQLPMFSRVGQAAYKPGLETSERLDAFFNHPHKRFKSIHVGGTNGKGSTSHMLASVLQAQGYKVGLYTSPHLVDFRERIKVNGEMISEEGVVDFIDKYLKSGYDGHPSFFELTMMMAFDWFAHQEVDYAVIEVGMGGRLDSTNIITPILSVITNISPDHTQFLGDTLPKIAAEKAGIIKSGIPVVIGEAEGEIAEVFDSRAKDMKTRIVHAYEQPYPQKECGLKGIYQKYNLRTVCAAIEELRRLGVAISEHAEIEGLRNVVESTGLRGRWMRLNDSPPAYCDTGHNEAGLGYVLTQIREEMDAHNLRNLRFVVGFVADKAIDKILGLLPKGAIYYFTNAAIPRALPVDQLVDKASQHGLSGTPYPSVKEAYAHAVADADPATDFIFVGGSTFIVADLLA